MHPVHWPSRGSWLSTVQNRMLDQRNHQSGPAGLFWSSDTVLPSALDLRYSKHLKMLSWPEQLPTSLSASQCCHSRLCGQQQVVCLPQHHRRCSQNAKAFFGATQQLLLQQDISLTSHSKPSSSNHAGGYSTFSNCLFSRHLPETLCLTSDYFTELVCSIKRSPVSQTQPSGCFNELLQQARGGQHSSSNRENHLWSAHSLHAHTHTHPDTNTLVKQWAVIQPSNPLTCLILQTQKDQSFATLHCDLKEDITRPSTSCSSRRQAHLHKGRPKTTTTRRRP